MVTRKSVQKAYDWLYLKLTYSTTPEMRAAYRERLNYLTRHGKLICDGLGEEMSPVTAPELEDERQLMLVRR